MGTNYAPLLAFLVLFTLSLSDNNQAGAIEALNST